MFLYLHIHTSIPFTLTLGRRIFRRTVAGPFLIRALLDNQKVAPRINIVYVKQKKQQFLSFNFLYPCGKEYK